MKNAQHNHRTTAKDLNGLNGTYILTSEPASPETLSREITRQAYDQYRIRLDSYYLTDIISATGTTDQPNQPRLWKRIEAEWKRRNRLPNTDRQRIEYKLSESLAPIISDLQKELNKTEKKTLYWRITDDIQNICENGTSDGYGNPSSC